MKLVVEARRSLIWASDSVRQHGLRLTIKKIISTLLDTSYDWRHGTETRKPVWSDDLDTFSLNKAYANRYGATKARPFVRLLTELQLPRHATFVDLGAGKGRVLLLAAEYGFKRVVGVEFSNRLCAQARQNLESFTRTRPIVSEIEIVHSDVVDYPIPDGEVAFYFNNSFQAAVLRQVLQRIRHSVESVPRRICMIYSPPVHNSLVEQAGIFHRSQFYEFGGVEFKVYFH